MNLTKQQDMVTDFTHHEDQLLLDRNVLDVGRFVSRTRGFFVATETANYRFSLLADDAIELYFNPEGEDPDGAVSQHLMRVKFKVFLHLIISRKIYIS